MKNQQFQRNKRSEIICSSMKYKYLPPKGLLCFASSPAFLPRYSFQKAFSTQYGGPLPPCHHHQSHYNNDNNNNYYYYYYYQHHYNYDVPSIKHTPCFLQKPRWSMVSELHIPQYRQTKLPFILSADEIAARHLQEHTYATTAFHDNDNEDDPWERMIPFEDGHLCFRTRRPVLTAPECRLVVDEAEEVCARRERGWTTRRHTNYPTTDIPVGELPRTMDLLREALYTRVYPLLRAQFAPFLPSGGKTLRVVDGFVVKYDAHGGQTELKPHRDGSVLSFNIALNPASEFEGGGTWFNSIQKAVKIQQGEICTHASGVLHGGHPITNGKRYILVAFVIVEGYDSWSMRFYNQIRHL